MRTAPTSFAAPAPWFVWPFFLVVAWLAFVAASLALCGGGFIHAEAYHYIPHYLTHRPFWDLVFDVGNTEGCLRARELSHIFDWLDSQVIELGVLAGVPHFFSTSHYLFHLVAGLAFWGVCTRWLGLSNAASFCLVLLLWTSPSAMLYTSYFRTAKPGVMMMVFIAAWLHGLALRRVNPPGAWIACTLFGLSLFGLFWFDEQGLYLEGVAVLLLAWKFFSRHEDVDKRLLVTGCASMSLSLAFRYFASPGITWALLHQTVDRSFEQLPLGQVLHQPATCLKILTGAPLMVLDAFRFTAGDLPVGLALAAVGGMFWTFRRHSGFPKSSRPQWVFAGLCGLLVVMYVLMLVRADYLVSSEHRRFLYCLPSSAVWLLVTAFVVSRLSHLQPRTVEAVLALLVVGNLFALQEHRFVLRHGYYKLAIAQAAELRGKLAPNALGSEKMDGETVRARFQAAMAQPAEYFGPPEDSPLYLYFLARANGVNL